MGFSIKTFGKGWLQSLQRLASGTTWKEDLIRGFELLKTGGASIADRSFSEIESARLKRSLDQIDEKLTLAFQALGKKSMDHWTNHQILDEKEKIRAIQTIETLQKGREKVLEQMAALKTSTQTENPSTATPPRAKGSHPDQ